MGSGLSFLTAWWPSSRTGLSQSVPFPTDQGLSVHPHRWNNAQLQEMPTFSTQAFQSVFGVKFFNLNF